MIVRSLFLLFVICQIVVSQAVRIPEGSFSMGSSCSDCDSDEQPVHTVQVSSFQIDKYEVTYAQYDSCVRSGGCTPAHYDDGKCLMWNSGGFRNVVVPKGYRDPKYPVVCVSWHQAQQYCRFTKGKLPSESQWEYAAQAGERKQYSWGGAAPGPQRCTMPKNDHPSDVGSYSANNWGLDDMTGNVWEWMSDFYDREYYNISPPQDPQGPEAGLYRVIRGGGWYSGPRQMRITNRHWFSPDYAEVSIGFRCVH